MIHAVIHSEHISLWEHLAMTDEWKFIGSCWGILDEIRYGVCDKKLVILLNNKYNTGVKAGIIFADKISKGAL